MTIGIFDSLSNYFDDYGIYLGVDNLELIVDVKCDISDAISWKLYVDIPVADPVLKTDTTRVMWTCEPYEKTKIRYIIKKADLPVIGIYKFCAFVVWNDKSIPGESAMFIVRALNT